MRKKVIYLEAAIKGNYEHIRDIENDLFISFWELMEEVGHNFEVDNNEYINIIDELIDLGNATVGDYYITLDNRNVDNLELLYKAKAEFMEELKNE